MNAAELRDSTARRDAQSTSPYEIRFTDPAAWLASLDADVALDAITDNIVWLSVTTGPATLEQVEAKWSAGGNREVRTFGSRYVTANYIARNQMLTLSAYAGVVWTEGEAVGFAREKSEQTAMRLQEVMRKVQVGLSHHKGLQVRSGGAMHLHTDLESWQAHPDASIEVPQELTCADCKEPIYWANNAFRHKATGRAEVNVERPGRGGRQVLALHHLASPDEAGKKV